MRRVLVSCVIVGHLIPATAHGTDTPAVELVAPRIRYAEGQPIEVRLTASRRPSRPLAVMIDVAVDAPGGRQTSHRVNVILGPRRPSSTVDLGPKTLSVPSSAWREGSVLRARVHTVNGARPADDAFVEIRVASEVSTAVEDGGPWGVAGSNTSNRMGHRWQPHLRTAGVDWVRGFDRRPSHARSALRSLFRSGFRTTGILQWSAGDGFPDEDLPGWTRAVRTLLRAGDRRVRQWEIWNEPPNFSDDKNPAHYAAIVRRAYRVVKAHDPQMAVGIAGASVNLGFIRQALGAGAADHFDYITLHPYESLAVAIDNGLEATFLSIVPAVQKMLAAYNPRKRNVPVVFTELGTPVAWPQEKRQGVDAAERTRREVRQASTLIKAYALSLAQGAARVHWFEPIDAEGLTFGLLRLDRNRPPYERPSYVALRTLIQTLSHTPKFIGWMPLPPDCRGPVFSANGHPVLMAWCYRPTPLHFGRVLAVTDPLTGDQTATDHISVSGNPILVRNIPKKWRRQAKRHLHAPYPWQKDHSAAKTIAFSAQDNDGLHLVGDAHIVSVDGDRVLDAGRGSGLRFAVDPGFLLVDPVPLTVIATVRFGGDPSSPETATPGFNLRYEQPTGLQNHDAGWQRIPRDTQWHDITWRIDTPMFVGQWGFNLWLNSDSAKYSHYLLKSLRITKRTPPSDGRQ